MRTGQVAPCKNPSTLVSSACLIAASPRSSPILSRSTISGSPQRRFTATRGLPARPPSRSKKTSSFTGPAIKHPTPNTPMMSSDARMGAIRSITARRLFHTSSQDFSATQRCKSMSENGSAEPSARLPSSHPAGKRASAERISTARSRTLPRRTANGTSSFIRDMKFDGCSSILLRAHAGQRLDAHLRDRLAFLDFVLCVVLHRGQDSRDCFAEHQVAILARPIVGELDLLRDRALELRRDVARKQLVRVERLLARGPFVRESEDSAEAAGRLLEFLDPR